MDKVIKITKRDYYLADDIFETAPIFTKGFRNARELIKKKNINEDNYIYATRKNDKWKETDGSSRKMDKIMLLKEWVENNVPEYSKKEIKYDIEMAPKIIY